ncbi:expressed tetratricopeptide repeat protein [Nitzschia inconspicua]|uniref:Expressed tetratricopeptide repeat protein n=1 Tax=Nitzschia inconspicua TaxID=303405 RepID=A0A9K3LVE3_9STRA|nr:expressed tetratricopeptide repeat protein [Nitzschia inconspicua]
MDVENRRYHTAVERGYTGGGSGASLDRKYHYLQSPSNHNHTSPKKHNNVRSERTSNCTSPAKPRASSVKSIASGSIHLSTNPTAAVCGLGSTWWNDDPIDHDDDGTSRAEFQIQDLIFKLSNNNTSLPLIQSMACTNNTTSRMETDDPSDEENNPVVSHDNYNHNHSNNSRRISTPPRVNSLYTHIDEGVVQTSDSAMDNRQSYCKYKSLPNGRSSIDKHNGRGNEATTTATTTTRYNMYPSSRTGISDDDMSSLGATASNEFFDCIRMDTRALVDSSLFSRYHQRVGKRQRLPSEMKLYQREHSIASGGGTSFPAIEVPFSESPRVASHGQTLLRGTCGQDSTLMSTISPSIDRSTVAIPKKEQREIDYWKLRLDQSNQQWERIQRAAGKHTASMNSGCQQSADIRFNLGQAYMKSTQYELAMEQFVAAMNTWKRKHGPHHVTIGRALDAIGLAMMRKAQQKKSSKLAEPTETTMLMERAQQTLRQAFAIRFHQLGVWHVDTVETYNKLASVHLHLGELKEACQAYHQVFLVRQAIFGRCHPSVAISAHSLANVYYKLQMEQESLHWYQVAQSIYQDDLQLSHHHPTLAKLLKDRARLEQ